jgi:hypothetical protein
MADLTETARAFAGAYPYMFAYVIGMPVYLAVLIAARRSFVSILAAGLVLVPFAPLAVFHETAYWSPRRIGGLPVGVEDALYLFVSGSFAYALAGLVHPFPQIRISGVTRAARRVALITIAALVVSIALPLPRLAASWPVALSPALPVSPASRSGHPGRGRRWPQAPDPRCTMAPTLPVFSPSILISPRRLHPVPVLPRYS